MFNDEFDFKIIKQYIKKKSIIIFEKSNKM